VIKVAMIGAGSVVFSKNLTGDILSFPEFKNATLRYVDVDADRLEVGAALCHKVARALGAEPTIQATTDRREALRGADFVINMVQIGSFDSTLVDFEIPRKYGLNFTIADTTGPGGIFRALRTFPMLSALCCDMQELCPSALLLNYSNPMSMNMQTITRTSSVPAIGLCHSVQGTLDQLASYIGEDPAQVAFVCAGINHLAFYLRIEKDGHDLYPRLFQAMENPDVYGTNQVRFELMKRLGYFVTESSEHNAEYSPYFLSHGPEHAAKFNVPIDEYLRRCDCIVDEFQRLKAFSRTDEPIEVHRSHEYGSSIIHSIVTGTPRVVYGNMPNRGAISNLPPNAIAEAPTLVDRTGCRFTAVGELPPQLLGYVMPHMIQHELFIRAAMEGRRDHVYQACMTDPLTAATMPLDRIVEMCDELIAAHGSLLPPLDSKRTLVPSSGKPFPPVDPKALRAAWDAAQTKCAEDYLLDWHLIGPFPAEPNARNGLSLQTPVESALAPDGSINLRAPIQFGSHTFKWRPVRATRRGYVDLGKLLGKIDWSVAYAYAGIDSPHPRDAILRCGSDDGIQIRLNGAIIHRHEVGRSHVPDSDRAPAHLQPGRNHLLVKIDNYHGTWGFSLALPKPLF
jgi:alpha-galactosidase